MPPTKKKKTTPKPGSSGGPDDEGYRKKRDRNNQVNILFFFLSIADCWKLIMLSKDACSVEINAIYFINMASEIPFIHSICIFH